MDFGIADTFTDSLARLTGDEQKAVKTTAFDLQLNPVNPGMSFHKLAKAKDKRFWSVRVSQDIRLIVHRTDDSLLLCYVDHHDKAYAWAERRRLETHPATGAAQLVEIRERVQEIVVPAYVPLPQTAVAHKPLFAHMPHEQLLAYGVPTEWLSDVRQATEDTILGLADHLPAEAAEALLELATGGTPQQAQTAPTAADPFEHPDAQRRFRVVADVDALETVARRLHDGMLGRAQVVSRDGLRELVREAARESGAQKFSLGFLLSEWTEVVDAWQIVSWEAYRDVARLGRKTRLPEN